MDIGAIVTIAKREYRGVVRNRWFLLFSLGFALLSAALAWLGLAGAGYSGFSGLGKTGASLINLIMLALPLVGMALGAVNLASERERGLLLYLFAQPASASEILIGKFLGVSLSIIVSLLLGMGLGGLFIFYFGKSEILPFINLLFFSILLGLVSLSLGFLLSTICSRVSSAVGMAVLVWLGLIFMGDLGVMATIVALKLDIHTAFILSLINPTQVFKLAAFQVLRGNLDALGPAGIYALRTYGNGLLFLNMGILIAWMAIPFLIVRLLIKKRIIP